MRPEVEVLGKFQATAMIAGTSELSETILLQWI